MKYFFSLLVLISSLIPKVKSQDIGTAINSYTNSYPVEQAYLHLDNNIYSPGDTVWFKAYVLANSLPSALSTNLYVGWYNASGKLLSQQVYPIYNATANGQFPVPANYTGNAIHLLAFTKWMLNGEPGFLFHKNIFILSSKTAKSSAQKTETQKIVLQFFPEGGNLIANVVNKVAFKATDQYGNPVVLNGIIKNNLEDSVTSFATVRDGMGYFYIKPKEGESYVATYDHSPGKFSSVDLPGIQSSGISMEVFSNNDSRNVIIRRNKNNNADLDHIHLLATFNGTVAYLSNINFNQADSITTGIQVKGFPSGILTITILDSGWNPLAERISFIRGNDIDVNMPQLSVVKKDLNEKGLNTFSLQSTDTTEANLSVAITDAELPADTTSDIINYLLLTGQLKGVVNDPAYYFADTTLQRQQGLDLVMLTNGWRRYKWQEIVAGVKPKLPYTRDSSYFFLLGEITNKKNKLPKNISFIIKGNDSFGYYSFSVNEDGSFKESSFITFDTTSIGYRPAKHEGNLEFQFSELPKATYSSYPFPVDKSTTKAEQVALSLSPGYYKNMLPEVIISGRKYENRIDSIERRYESPEFADAPAFRSAYVEDDPILGTYGADFGAFILSKLGVIPGNAKYFMDEQPVPKDAAYAFPVSEIAFLKYYKYLVEAPGGGGSGGVVAIYTKRVFFDSTKRNIFPPSPFIIGYTISKEFYSPDYSKIKNKDSVADNRKTLYWNPQVDLNNKEKKHFLISFYNNDVSKKIRIIIEGIKVDGTPVYIEKEVE